MRRDPSGSMVIVHCGPASPSKPALRPREPISIMTASSSWRKLDPGDEYVEEINREGVCGDEGWRLSRRPGRTEDAALEVIVAPRVAETPSERPPRSPVLAMVSALEL